MRCIYQSKSLTKFALLCCMAVATVLATAPVFAQSGSRNYPPAGSGSRPTPPAGSASRPAQPAAPLALEGYCPVSIIAMKQWVKGNPNYRSTFDGKTYYFAGAQGKQMFDADPTKYIPTLGGDCVVALVEKGRRMPGDIRHAAFSGGRLFLFTNADAKQMFLGNPAKYVNADLAYGGNCVVCRVGMQRQVAGKPEFMVIHKGMRYLFPGADQRGEFLANPARYEVAAAAGRPAPGSSPAGSSPRGGGGSSGQRRPSGNGSGSR